LLFGGKPQLFFMDNVGNFDRNNNCTETLSRTFNLGISTISDASASMPANRSTRRFGMGIEIILFCRRYRGSHGMVKPIEVETFNVGHHLLS
jgi:hypothetical protein